VSSKASAERCREALNFAGLIDNADPARPRLMSLFPLPAPPPGAPYRNFREKGRRFGPHNVNQEIHLPDVEKPGNLIYLTYFTAGLRVFDIKVPAMPRLVHSAAAGQECRPAADGSGNADRRRPRRHPQLYHITDRNWGLWITRYTGPGQPRRIGEVPSKPSPVRQDAGLGVGADPTTSPGWASPGTICSCDGSGFGRPYKRACPSRNALGWGLHLSLLRPGRMDQADVSRSRAGEAEE
jgi:hypothetical protein